LGQRAESSDEEFLSSIDLATNADLP